MYPRVRIVAAVAVAACMSLAVPSLAVAKVKIDVDLDTQTMHVESKDKSFDWKISSGAEGYDTPPGSYGVLWMDKDHKSDEYDQAPMPNAIFFKPGFAIHGSPKSNWGHPASHGCIRLPVAKSAILFDLVKAEGADVTIIGNTPATIEASTRRPARDADGFYDGPPVYEEPRTAAPDYGYTYAAPQADFFGSAY